MIEERHGGSLSVPLVCGTYFSVGMTLDAIIKRLGGKYLNKFVFTK